MIQPNAKPAGNTGRQASTSGAARRAASLCLIVHDELDLRLRLASLVRRALPTLGADSIDRSTFAAMTVDRLSAYVSVLFIIEFSLPANGTDPLANVTRLRAQAHHVPILVFGRGGDERAAVRSMKAGAVDYWPIHAVKIDELGQTLKPLAEPPPVANAATSLRPVDRRRQPDIAGYRILKKIARSAMATVYLAQNNELTQPVALKVQPIEGSQAGSAASRQGFVRECKILSALNHRSIANVLDFGITDDYLYLALEYFPCGSLRERMRNPVRMADALNYAGQIGEALQVLHAAQVVHCDLKPSNVMLTDDNRVVLIDFGSARSQLVSADLSRSDLATGTPYYVCPEQIAGHTPDARGDLYSLGVVLFEMLVGALPFAGATLAEIFSAHRSADVPRLPKHIAHLQAIIDRLLAKDPGDRYVSALAFLEALNAAAGTPTTQSPPSAAIPQGALDS